MASFLEVVAKLKLPASRRRCGAAPCSRRFPGRCACRRRGCTSGWSSRACGAALSQEHVLELVHAGIGEQQRRVVAGHHRRAGNDLVAFGSENFRKVGGCRAFMGARCRRGLDGRPSCARLIPGAGLHYPMRPRALGPAAGLCNDGRPMPMERCHAARCPAELEPQHQCRTAGPAQCLGGPAWAMHKSSRRAVTPGLGRGGPALHRLRRRHRRAQHRPPPRR